MGARNAGSTSTSDTDSRLPWRSSALPPSASRLRTQFASDPSMETR